jgi:hypothetical protein
MTKLPDGRYVRDRAGLPHRLLAAGQPLEKCSFVLLAVGVRLDPRTHLSEGATRPQQRFWTRLPVRSDARPGFARNPYRRGAHVRGGLGTIVGASLLGMGIACLETPTFEDLE